MALQGSLFIPVKDWKPAEVSSLPKWPAKGNIGIDIETCDPKLSELGPGVRRGGYICGIAFAIEDGPAHYLPIAHGNGNNMPKEHALAYVRDQMAAFHGSLVGANLQYDIDYLMQTGCVPHRDAKLKDIQTAEVLLDDLQDRYSLDAIGKRRGLGAKDEGELIDACKVFGFKGSPKNHIWKLPPNCVEKYALQDVRLPLTILRQQERQIEAEELDEVWALETRVLPHLIAMRRRGVRVSLERLEQVEKWAKAEIVKQLAIANETLTRKVRVEDVWQAEHIATSLGELGVESIADGKGGYSVTNDWLKTIKIPAAAALIRARQISKLQSMCIDSTRAHLIGDRIHPTFNPLRGEKEDGNPAGVPYGRLSCSDPNLQQQPGRDDEIGPMWRSIYLPDEGKTWASCDYSQQEPRLMVHYAELLKAHGSSVVGDRYRNDPDTDNHTMMAQLTGLRRTEAKNIFLGLCYGMGGGKLARELKLPTEWVMSKRLGKMIEVAGPEAKAILDKFHEAVPFVKHVVDVCMKAADNRGFIRTLTDRKCRFPQRADGNGYEWTYKAVNRLIQGSAADQTKYALCAALEAGFTVNLQIHDELDCSVNNREEAEEVARIMREVVTLTVPNKVSVKMGPSWGEAA